MNSPFNVTLRQLKNQNFCSKSIIIPFGVENPKISALDPIPDCRSA